MTKSGSTGTARARAAAGCGLAAATLALLIPLLAASGEPAYSHRRQFISELGATGAAHGTMVAALGFAPIGVLTLAFFTLLYGLLPHTSQNTRGIVCLAAVGVAYVVSAWFPCDAGCPSTGSWSQAIHNAFGLLEYTGGVVGLLLLGSGLQRSAPWKALAPACFGAALITAAGFIAMLLPALGDRRGWSQRLAEAALFGWIVWVSGFVWHKRSRF